MKSVILIACFLPLAIIYIVMKLALWLSATSAESKYVKEESKKPHGPYLADAYADVDEEEEEYWNITDN
tara:strand:- start:207 stop:413 length:207 start_codon:yes stop_codon:yes gene_type:complete